MTRWAWLLFAALLAPSAAAAQPGRAGERFLTARVGANLVGNTYRVRDEPATAGAGFSGGVFLSPYWLTEVEVWFRGSSPECCTGRERLISLNAERLYTTSGLQPYLAGGLALLHRAGTQLRPDSRLLLQVQVTAGVRVPVSRRFSVDLDLRGNGGGSTMIVRPTAGATYFF